MFNLIVLGVRYFWVCVLDYCINQIEFDDLIGKFGFFGFYWVVGNKDYWNIQVQGSYQYFWGDFVVVRDVDYGVGVVGVDYIFNGISDQFVRWQ